MRAPHLGRTYRKRLAHETGHYSVSLTRLALLAESNVCHYCGIILTGRTATADHIIPKSKGGTDHVSNLVLACKTCNAEKGDSDYEVFMASKFPLRQALGRLRSSGFGVR